MSRRPLLVPVGDPAGVGPEVAVAGALELAEHHDVTLIGDGARLLRMLPRHRARLSVLDVGAVADSVVDAHAPSAEGGLAQLAALDRAIDEALAGRGRAIVTGPTCKAAIERAGVPFRGQTEHLARRAGLPDDAVTMMFLGPRLKVALATTHLSIEAAASTLERRHVERAIAHLVSALERGSAGSRPSVAVTGLNPHAGEEGLFGREEIDVIRPAVEAARRSLSSRATLVGPLGAETAFRNAAAGEVTGVVAMIHDQATIASKLLDWGEAVNVTWGLPFVRTSVDHGVAYDAARDGTASSQGMKAALRLALELTEGAA